MVSHLRFAICYLLLSEAGASLDEQLALDLVLSMIAILGATGKVGRATIAKLRDEQAPVKAVVRASSDTADLKTLGCEIAIADLHDSTAVAKAIEGAKAVQVICPVSARAKDAASDMASIIDAIACALIARPPETVLLSRITAHLADPPKDVAGSYYLLSAICYLLFSEAGASLPRLAQA